MVNSIQPRKPVIVFDLDGTLLNSLQDICTTFLSAFDICGLPKPSYNEVRGLIGAPLGHMYAHFANPEDVPRLAATYRAEYKIHCTDTTAPYAGVLEVLETLRARGYRLAVATTKLTWVAEDVCAKVGLTPYLDHIQGTDGFPHKPAPDVIYRALAAVGAPAAWMVGDTTGDLLAGKAAGLRTYGVSWGTHPAERLAAVHPDVLSDSLDALLLHCP